MCYLILGGDGMLGHKLYQVLSKNFDVYGTVRSKSVFYKNNSVLNRFRLIDQVSAENFDSVVLAVSKVHPKVIINCIGIVKQHLSAQDPLSSIAVNSLFPHRLAQLCQAGNIRLIHISTDCVFSGRQGNYSESDTADAGDLYGQTKLLGEVSGRGCLTLRTSIIGRELQGSQGLIEWFLSQEGHTVQGYKKAVFSGFTTNALAEIIAQIIIDHPNLHGVWHVASEPISKYDLLQSVKQAYGLDILIEPDETVVVDRSLNAERFRQATGFVPPAWHHMINQMYQDLTPYLELRRLHAHQ